MQRTLVKETIDKVNKSVTLKGWVSTVRDHGKISFIDLRDRTGVIQCVGQNLEKVTTESVVEITGKIVERPEKLVNKEIETGKIELQIEKLVVISMASELPLPIDTEGYDIDENVRTKFRYLDLRRPRMAKNIRIRSKVTQFLRNYLAGNDFVEIETPILTKTTPEGARDFLVPSRLQQGKFYALPQSPQQYKQLLMVAGMERYFQIARCFRDEDPRKDRAYGEFTQLDIEMSFIEQNDILELTEKMFTELVKEVFPEKKVQKSPWPRISHKDAKEKYGNDKPDLRVDKNDPNELAFCWIVDFPLFTEQSKEDFFHGSGDAKWAPSHHMFTSPHPDDLDLLETDPSKVRGLQHDMVLNGLEVGGGSIRISDPKIQEKIFKLIGFSEKQRAQFDHMLTAFTYGVPPHGGIAPGLDRFMMAILGEPSVREVMAYPTSSSGQTSVLDAPSEAVTEQLEELGIKLSVNREIDKVGSVYEKIISLLKKNNINYKHYEHEPVFTSEEAAKVRNTNIHQGAKALVLQADKEFILLVLPADLKADLKTIQKNKGYKKLAMASKESVKAKTGLEVGCIPPFGSTIGLITIVDSRLSENDEIVFNAGRHDRSVKMQYSDFIKLEKPEILLPNEN